MEVEGGLFLDIVIIFGAAFLGGLLARIMRLPILLGYLIAGIVIGPHALQFIGNLDEVQTLAEFGVILLLFAVGIEVSFRELRDLGKSVIVIAIGQIFVTIGIVWRLGRSYRPGVHYEVRNRGLIARPLAQRTPEHGRAEIQRTD